MTWKMIFELVMDLWDVNQSDIARYLGVHRSTISRLVNVPKRALKSQKIEEIYSKLFDPNTPKSLANDKGTTTDNLLIYLKDELKELKLDKDLIHLWNKDYETFVRELLKLARGNESRKPSLPQNKCNYALPDIKKTQQDSETTTSEISVEFQQDVDGFGIKEFINQSPFESLCAYQIEDAITFYNRISSKHKQHNGPDKDSTLYQNILNFIDTLLEYIKLLKRCSDSTKNFPWDFEPLKKIELSQEIETVRKKLQLIYNGITATIQDKLEK